MINTQENVVLDHACVVGTFRRDPHIQQQQTKSVLCMRLLHQSQLSGILYLENNWVTGAFTPKRLEILQLLSAPIAISIKNALYYEQQEQIHRAEQASDCS
ncbi:serine/threonine kinase with two-component sensor domain [Beggiatoa sp. PS]|nr:serine/threonine kinase with two-component sensor domain [Beggiatoa sp. PS]